MAEQKQQKDYWMKDNSIFVCDGWKYGIAPDGSTVCVGPVSGATLTPQDSKNSVTKIPTKGIAPMKTVQTQKKGIMLHPGRPRKPQGEQICRMTQWRREKEKQGVLL